MVLVRGIYENGNSKGTEVIRAPWIWYPRLSPDSSKLYYYLPKQKSWGWEFYFCPGFCPKMLTGPWLRKLSFETFVFSNNSKICNPPKILL